MKPVVTHDQVALVSGANRGLGAAVAQLLAEHGMTTIAGSRDPATVPHRQGVLPVQLDVTDAASIERMRRRVLDTHGRLDVLINNAGVYHDRSPDASPPPVETWDPELLTSTLAVNVTGTLRLTRAFLPTMRSQDHGRIVNVSSGRGRFADLDGDGPFYRISKTALNALTVVLAADTGAHDILVNAVCPGWVRTRMGGPAGLRDVREAADGIVWAACLPAGGPSGQFFRDRRPLDWCVK